MDSSQTVSFPSIEAVKDPFADTFTSPNASTRTYPRTFASGNQQGVQTLSDSRVFFDSGNGRIVFSDNDGSKIILGIDVDSDVFGFSFYNSDGKNILRLGKSTGTSNSLGFTLLDEDGHDILQLGQNSGNDIGFSFYQIDGTKLLQLGTTDTVSAGFSFYDAVGAPIIQIGKTSVGLLGMGMFDASVNRMHIGKQPDGRVAVVVTKDGYSINDAYQ